MINCSSQLVDRRSKKAGMALERAGVKARFASQYLPCDFADSGIFMEVGKKRIVPGSLALPGYHRVDIQSEEYAWLRLVFPLVSQGKTILRTNGTLDNYFKHFWKSRTAPVALS